MCTPHPDLSTSTRAKACPRCERSAEYQAKVLSSVQNAFCAVFFGSDRFMHLRLTCMSCGFQHRTLDELTTHAAGTACTTSHH
eukprot:2807273-Amphidinium_carterae.1